MKVVIDTNVVVSAIFFGGRPRQLLEELLLRNIDTVASPEIFTEYQETIDELRSRYPDRPVQIPFPAIVAACSLVTPSDHFKVCRDPDDDKFIDCAVAGKCIYIISGDKDLLSLENFREIEILTVSQFFSRYVPRFHEERPSTN